MDLHEIQIRILTEVNPRKRMMLLDLMWACIIYGKESHKFQYLLNNFNFIYS